MGEEIGKVVIISSRGRITPTMVEGIMALDQISGQEPMVFEDRIQYTVGANLC